MDSDGPGLIYELIFSYFNRTQFTNLITAINDLRGVEIEGRFPVFAVSTNDHCILLEILTPWHCRPPSFNNLLATSSVSSGGPAFPQRLKYEFPQGFSSLSSPHPYSPAP